mmetsp:Transcript_18688/g.43260  ORF Transcript_18688/g.43260 Transcript_18688/m.43260 type:complete len:219 (-) Transcript_18688:2285-2941(-)
MVAAFDSLIVARPPPPPPPLEADSLFFISWRALANFMHWADVGNWRFLFPCLLLSKEMMLTEKVDMSSKADLTWLRSRRQSTFALVVSFPGTDCTSVIPSFPTITLVPFSNGIITDPSFKSRSIDGAMTIGFVHSSPLEGTTVIGCPSSYPTEVVSLIGFSSAPLLSSFTGIGFVSVPLIGDSLIGFVSVPLIGENSAVFFWSFEQFFAGVGVVNLIG